MEDRLLPSLTILVNTAADENTRDNTLSLREAIELSNGTLSVSDLSPAEHALVSSDSLSGPNTIDFKIGSGVQTIAPTSALPTITAPVVIDGTSQPGYNPSLPAPVIELTGMSITDPGVNGLTIDAGGSTVNGLVINQFSGSGLLLEDNGGDLVEGCYIGTDDSGTTALPNADDGVFIRDASDNTIGGTAPGASNLISGNSNDGIILTNSDTTRNLVAGNFIGTDASGSMPLGNGGAGVSLFGASGNTVGGTTAMARNVISANGTVGFPGSDGVLIYELATGNLVQGNFIGTDFSGTTIQGLGNVNNGVDISGPLPGTTGGIPSNNTIGGTAPGAGNLISGNGTSNDPSVAGVLITLGASNNLVQGNKIGTDEGALTRWATSTSASPSTPGPATRSAGPPPRPATSFRATRARAWPSPPTRARRPATSSWGITSAPTRPARFSWATAWTAWRSSARRATRSVGPPPAPATSSRETKTTASVSSPARPATWSWAT